jgi:hypothetical protein
MFSLNVLDEKCFAAIATGQEQQRQTVIDEQRRCVRCASASQMKRKEAPQSTVKPSASEISKNIILLAENVHHPTPTTSSKVVSSFVGLFRDGIFFFFFFVIIIDIDFCVFLPNDNNNNRLLLYLPLGNDKHRQPPPPLSAQPRLRCRSRNWLPSLSSLQRRRILPIPR